MLQVKNYSKRYGDFLAVDGLNLQVDPGKIVGFIGHNGAGKTTTLKSIAGILDFEEGQILIGGHDIKTDELAAKRMTAFIPDNPDLYDFLKGIEYLNFIADIYSIDQKTREELTHFYADAFDLTKDLGNVISSYSHGMKQKLALISAFIRRPRLLLLDEPFVGLDPIASHQLKGFLRELCDQGGAVLFSTHVLEVAQKLCEEIAIIKQGKLVVFGETEQVTSKASLEDVFLELSEEAAQ